jgi:hypothetical protein
VSSPIILASSMIISSGTTRWASGALTGEPPADDLCRERARTESGSLPGANLTFKPYSSIDFGVAATGKLDLLQTTHCSTTNLTPSAAGSLRQVIGAMSQELLNA